MSDPPVESISASALDLGRAEVNIFLASEFLDFYLFPN